MTDDRQYREIKYEESTMSIKKINGNDKVDIFVDGKWSSSLISKDENGNIDLVPDTTTDKSDWGVGEWDNYFKLRS